MEKRFWLLATLAIAACGKEIATGPDGPVAASVTVTSDIDTIIPRSLTAQLSATAVDQTGAAISGARFLWTSSNASVATVNTSGLVSPQTAGGVSVTATTDGLGDVSGRIGLRVVEADLTTVRALAGDSFAGALVAALSTAQKPAVQAAWNACGTGASSGNVVDIIECLSQLRTAAGSASEPTDRALLAVALIFADQIERRLGL